MGVSEALVTQRANLMRHILICDLPSSTIFFHIISQTARLQNKKLLKIKCVFVFSTNFSETFLILRRTERDMIKKVYWSSCKIAAVLARL